MTETVKAYHRDAAGNVTEHVLPAIEATQAARKHPHQWSLDGKRWGEVPQPKPANHVGGLHAMPGVGVPHEHAPEPVA